MTEHQNYVKFKLKNGVNIIANNAQEIKHALDNNYNDIIAIILNIPKVNNMQFYMLPELMEVIITRHMKISSWAFGNCSKLEQITIKGNYTVTFEPNAFLGCDSLKRIVGIPMNVIVSSPF